MSIYQQCHVRCQTLAFLGQQEINKEFDGIEGAEQERRYRAMRGSGCALVFEL
jgi:hypothetical protein